jgi:tRNA threonylcarbamoyl adenosine modification protein YeaZ
VDRPVSIAIETSCRLGGVALGVGEVLVSEVDFDAGSRHAAQLVSRLAGMLAGQSLRPAQLDEVYVSVGPGSFTGTRVAVTVGRMLAQTVPGLRVVAVPTTAAVAQAARELAWQRLGVILDAREGLIYAETFIRPGGPIVADGPKGVMTPREYLAAAGRPLALVGEGLTYHAMPDELVLAPHSLDATPHLPSAGNVWRVGRQMAAAGLFTDYRRLEPIYCRKPEALRVWERTHGQQPK